MKCADCLLIECICDAIPAVPSALEFLIIRHVNERNKASNSVRLAGRALARVEVVDWGAQGLDWRPDDEHWEGAALLLNDRPDAGLADPPKRIVVVDGSWPQARRMARRIPQLWSLPRIVVQGSPERARMRVPPEPGGLATLEAIARVVERFEGWEMAAPLDALFDEQVRRVRRARGVGAR